MKLLVAVLSDTQANGAVEALLEAGWRVTRLSTTGGLLRQGNTTLMIGVEDEDVEKVLEVVRQRAPGALAVVLPLERYERV